MTVHTRQAEREDLEEVSGLLAAADLPELEPHPTLANVVVAETEGKVVGAIVLAVFGRSGLVRAVVVAPDHRGQGVGRDLFRTLLSRAHELGLKALFCAATEAEGFFEKLGFVPARADDLPLTMRGRGGIPDPSGPVLRLRLQ